MINKSCLACDCFRDDCVGRDYDMCGNFKTIDLNRASPGPAAKKRVLNYTEQIQAVEGGETRQQKFMRIGGKRQEQALEAIRKLEHLTSRYYRKRSGVTTYTYTWTAEQVLGLIQPIEEALENLKAELIACDTPREHGLIEVSSD